MKESEESKYLEIGKVYEDDVLSFNSKLYYFHILSPKISSKD